MDTAQAIEFVVQQVVEQASIEGVSLSDPEKRRMCVAADASSSGDGFASHNLIVYEGKISTLLHHAHHRIRDENAENIKMWGRALRTLRDGDHYLFQLWDILPESEPSSGSRLRRIGVSAVIAIAAMAALIVWVVLRHGK